MKKPVLLAIGAIFLFASSVLTRNFYLYDNFCFHNYDLGVHLEAIKRFSEGSLNPWIFGRQIHFFQDHWEPIDLLISPLARLLPLHIVGMGVEVLFFCLAAIVILFFSHKNLLVGVFFSILLILNRDIFESAYYPIHPGAMVILPLALMAVLLPQRKNILPLLLSFIFLTCFSEQFSLAGVGLVIALALFRETRGWALIFAPVVLVACWWVLKGRELFIGPLFAQHFVRLKLSPHEFLQIYNWDRSQLMTVLKFILGFIPLGWVLWESRKSWTRKHLISFILISGLFSPLLIGRILSNSFGFHYNIAVVLGLIAIGIALVDPSKLNPKVISMTFLFCLVFSNNKLMKAYRTVANHELDRCVREFSTAATLGERKDYLNEIAENISNQNDEKKVLVSGNLLPNFLEKIGAGQLYQLGAFEVTDTDHFNWVVLERNFVGDNSPVPQEEVEKAIASIKEGGTIEIIIDNPKLFFAHGRLDRKLINRFYYDQNYKPVF